MLRPTGGAWQPLGWLMLCGVTLVMVGCGGEPPPRVSEADAKSPSTAAPSDSAKSTGKGKAGIADGGDLTRQERKAAKFKEKQPAGQ
jgi:hypothetical protein